MMNSQLRANFSGHVQGVGFRYQTESISRKFAVQGYVQNLPDGSVVLVAEGKKSELEGFLKEIETRLAANIRKTNIGWYPETGQYAEFSIRR